MKGRGLGASEADACAMLKEERAATLTQFLVTRLVMQGGEEADGTLLSQDVEETRDQLSPGCVGREGVVFDA